MPTIFRYKGYRFFFYSNEGDPSEPLHVHVQKEKALAKIWLEPQVRIAGSFGLKPRELRELCKVAQEHIDQIREAWNEYFND